jgi:large repetitive protein
LRLLYSLVLAALALMAVAPAQAQQARSGPALAQAVSPDQMPNGYLLEPVHPNPFSTTATVGFAVTRTQRVDLALYDALGRRVRTLYNGPAEANARLEVVLDGRNLPSGLYLVRLAGTGFSTTRRATLLR